LQSSKRKWNSHLMEGKAWRQGALSIYEAR
jgi:hypothetical protein